MTSLKSERHDLLVAIIMGVFSAGLAPVVTASSTYDAMAELTFSLIDVTNIDGVRAIDGWEVIAFGAGSVFVTEIGDASASGSTSVVDPPVSLDIGDTITQSSAVSGTAGNGSAASDALTDLEIVIENFSEQALSFNVDYSAIANASATGYAMAIAQVGLLEQNGLLDIMVFSTARADDTSSVETSSHGPLGFVLQGGGNIRISGFIDSLGNTPLSVPIPAAVWLFGSGLLCVIGLARRNKRSLDNWGEK